MYFGNNLQSWPHLHSRHFGYLQLIVAANFEVVGSVDILPFSASAGTILHHRATRMQVWNKDGNFKRNANVIRPRTHPTAKRRKSTFRYSAYSFTSWFTTAYTTSHYFAPFCSSHCSRYIFDHCAGIGFQLGSDVKTLDCSECWESLKRFKSKPKLRLRKASGK